MAGARTPVSVVTVIHNQNEAQLLKMQIVRMRDAFAERSQLMY